MHGQGRQEFSQYRILQLRGRQDQTHRCVFRRHLSKRRLRQARRKLIGSCLMSLTLHFHPLASFCHKVLIALYENGTPFRSETVDLGDPGSAAAHMERWPVGKIPVLHDAQAKRVISETSIIIEYLQESHPGPVTLLPADS